MAEGRNLLTQYADETNLQTRISLHDQFGTSSVGWYSWVFEQFALPENARILEIGCGNAMLWARNTHRMPPGWSLVLSDFSEGMLDAARANLAGKGVPFELQLMNAEDLSFPDNSFDCVIANHVLHLVPNLDKVLAEIRRVLKPSGRLYAATNGENHLAELWSPQVLQILFPTVENREELVRRHRQFCLENGAEILRTHFPKLALALFEEHLLVPEPAPLLDYYRSVVKVDVLQEARLTYEISSHRTLQGQIRITKSQGMFHVSF